MVLQAIIRPRQFIYTPCSGLGSFGEVGVHPAELNDTSCGQIKLHGPPREIKRNRSLGGNSVNAQVVMDGKTTLLRKHIPPSRGAKVGPSEHIYL